MRVVGEAVQPRDSLCVGWYHRLAAVFPGTGHNNVLCKIPLEELSEDFITLLQTANINHGLCEPPASLSSSGGNGIVVYVLS